MDFTRRAKNLIERNNHFRRVFDFICATFVYQFLLDLKIRHYIKKIREKKNFNVIIETTNICNARCLMCPHTEMKRKKEVMDNKIFNLIIKRLKQDRISPLTFIVNGFGEPLVDRKIIERIAKLKDSFPTSQIKIYTNLSIIPEGKIKKLVASGLDELNISFNGFDKRSYEKVMGLDYDRSKRNIERLIYWRNKLNPDLRIRMSMALVVDNQHGIDRYIKSWEKKVNSVSVNRVHTYGGAVEDFSGEFKIDFDKKTFPCKYLWNTITIGVNGDVFLCCLDYEGTYCFGNINDEKILDIFYSQEFEKIRVLHRKGKIKKIGICKRCYTPYKNGQEWFIRDLY